MIIVKNLNLPQTKAKSITNIQKTLFPLNLINQGMNSP